MVFKDGEKGSKGEKTCKGQKDGCHETDAASPPANCAHAYEDGEGRTQI